MSIYAEITLFLAVNGHSVWIIYYWIFDYGWFTLV